MDLQYQFPLEVRDSVEYRCVYSADGVLLAFLSHRLDGKQVAEFIVHACNAHAGLVKTARAASDLLNRDITYDGKYVLLTFGSTDEAFSKVRAARESFRTALEAA